MNNISDDAEARLRRAASPLDAPVLDPALVTGADSRRAPRLLRHGRATRAAAASVSALAAVTVGALVITNPFAADAPLFVAASGNGGAAEAGAFSTADSRMALWIDYQYQAGAGLSADGGRGTVYELRRAGDPEKVLRDAADALGVSGDVTESTWSTPEYPTYLIGAEDGSAPSITLSWSGIGEWWYSDPSAYPQPVCTSVPVEGGAEGEFYDECTQPETPASASLAPSTAEATRIAAELFDVPESAISVTADDWQTTASANLVVDGQTTALVESISWSTLGRISWASGHSFEVIERGAYDTISPTAAVERLADGRWFGAAGPDYQGGMVAFAADSLVRGGADASTASGDGAASSEPSAPTEAPAADPGTEPGAEPTMPEPQVVDPGVGEPEVVDPGVIEPDMIDPGLLPGELPEPETVTVTLERSEATLLMVWDADGNVWLVPGYAFENPDGGFWHTVISLVEGVIALPEPMEIEPLPALVD